MAAQDAPCVFLVDTSREMLASLDALFRLEGIRTRLFESVEEVVMAALQLRPTAIFTSLSFAPGGTNPLEMIRRVREHPTLNDTVIAALSGWADEAARVAAMAAGCDFYLVKPAEPDELVDIVRRNSP